MTNPLRGMSTIRYQAADHAAAKRWYSEFLGVEPYFDRPGYCEFRIGDYQHELGILDAKFLGTLGGAERATAPAGVVVYWHVDDLQATLDRLVAMGATVHEPIREFGEGFVGAAVLDPFGNIVGLMYNVHFLSVLAERQAHPAGIRQASAVTA